MSEYLFMAHSETGKNEFSLKKKLGTRLIEFNESHIICLFTGKLDMHGQKIWDDDLLMYYGKRYQVKFIDGCFMMDGHSHGPRPIPELVERMGSIHENLVEQ